VTVLVVSGLLMLTACSGGSSSNDQPVSERLTAAKQSFDQARFIGFTLAGDDLPDGVTALRSAKGTGTHAPSFTGEVEIDRGLTFSAPLVAVDGKVYAKLPFVGWSTIDPADYGAPDPSNLMGTTNGLSSLLTKATGVTEAGSERSGSTVLTKFKGTLAGKDVQALFPSSGTSPYDVVFTLTDDNVLHSVTITGPFYGSDHGNVTYAIELDLSADPVTIAPPE
jgi:lipoprotein LprG